MTTRAALAVGGCIALGLFLWLRREAPVETDPTVSAESRAENAADTDLAPPNSRRTERESTAPDVPGKPTPTVHSVVEALASLRTSVESWPPHGNQRDFDAIDMSRLRSAVHASGVPSSELVRLALNAESEDPLRALCIAGIAFCSDTSSQELRILAREVEDQLRNGISSNDPASRACYAALFALQMHCADELRGAADLFLERYMKEPGSEALRDMTHCAIKYSSSLSSVSYEMISRSVLDMETPFITVTLWRALARGPIQQQLSVIEDALGGNGFAREGLESLSAGEHLPVLLTMIDAENESVYASHIARSACAALLVGKSVQSLDELTRLAREGRPSALAAVASTVVPLRLAALVNLRLSLEDDPAYGNLVPALEAGIRLAAERIMQCVVPPVEVTSICEQLTALGTNVSRLPAIAESVAWVIARHGTPDQMNHSRAYLFGALAGDVRKRLEEEYAKRIK